MVRRLVVLVLTRVVSLRVVLRVGPGCSSRALRLAVAGVVAVEQIEDYLGRGPRHFPVVEVVVLVLETAALHRRRIQVLG